LKIKELREYFSFSSGRAGLQMPLDMIYFVFFCIITMLKTGLLKFSPKHEAA